eukprot:g4474.t1
MEDIKDFVDLESAVEELEDADLLEEDDAPIIRLLNAVLAESLREKASDIHVEPYENEARVRFRLDGVLRTVLTPSVHIAPLLISRIKVMAKLDIAEKRLPQDGRMSVKLGGRSVDLRVSTMPSSYGERVVMRLLDKSAGKLSVDDLGMPKKTKKRLDEIIGRPHGIILVTGPTGSGKTTTLYAALQQMDRQQRNIMTVEDPVEYDLQGISQTQINMRAGMTFARGLRAILRQDPDVILIGEIRDKETAEIATQASLTGHLVLSTLHTNTAAGAVTRLQDLGIDSFLLSSTLRGVMAQRLVRRLCRHCKTPVEADAVAQRLLGMGADTGRRRKWHHLLLRVPGIGRWMEMANISDWARSLGTLLGSGVPALSALKIAASVMTNLYLRQRMEAVNEQMRRGSSLHNALKTEQVFKQLEGAQEKRVMNDIRAIEASLKFYKLDSFSYPSQSDGLQALVENPGDVRNWRGLYNAVSQQADERARLNDRFLGQTAAWNRLLDQYQLVEDWVPRGNQLGQRSGDTELYGRTWYWELETETTLGDNFYRYEVTTYLDPDTQDSQSVASLVAFYIVEHQLNAVRNSRALVAEQAILLALSAESWARSILRDDAADNNVDSFEDDWAQVIPVLPVEGGSMTGCIVDMQSKYNINNLGTINQEAYQQALADTGDDEVEIFLNILEYAGLDWTPERAAAVIDWIDADSDLIVSGSAEDAEYSLEDPARLSANARLTSVRWNWYASAQVVEAPPEEEEELAIANINAELLGVVVAGDDSVATIAVSRQGALVFRVGDEIDRNVSLEEVPSGLVGGSLQTKVISLNHVTASELVPVLKPMMSKGSLLQAYAAGNNLSETFLNAAGEGGEGAAEGSYTIQADTDNNAIVIAASASVIGQVQNVIRKLDRRRPQVLIEAIIASVSEDVARNISSQLSTVGRNTGGLVTSFDDVFTSLLGVIADDATADDDSDTTDASTVLAGVNNGITGGFGDFDSGSGEGWALLIQALATDTDTRILSTPSVLTLDNEEASLSVGQEVPFVTGSFTSSADSSTNPFQTIEREEVGVVLTVTPQINDADAVRLQISQEISSIAAALTEGRLPASDSTQDLVLENQPVEAAPAEVLPEPEPAANAYTQLLELWSLEQPVTRQTELCVLARQAGLECHTETNMDLAQLRGLGRPGVIRLQEADDQFSTYLLSGFAADQLRLSNATGEQMISSADLAAQWDGSFLYIWAPPAGYEDYLVVGKKNAMVVEWLQQQLAVWDSEYEEIITGGLYSSAISEQVKRFQVASGIKPDGILGRSTVISFNDLAGEYPSMGRE